MKRVVCFFFAVLLALPLFAQEPNAEIHNALRALKARLVAAMNKNDIDGILAELHPNVIVTWQNAEVSRGHKGVREYLERMTRGPHAAVRGYHGEFEADDLTTLYGDKSGIAFGNSTERFDLVGGKSFTLHGRWSATLVKENGRWLLSSVHASSNLFDNPLVSAAKKALYAGVLISFVVALLIGWFIGRRSRAKT
jgi:ketosteroid isomerase-like protein